MEHNHHPEKKNSDSMHEQHQHGTHTPPESPSKSANATHDHSKNPPHGHMGHDHHTMMINDFKKRFYVVLVLTIPIMLLSEMIQHWLNIHISFTGSQYILLLLSSIVFFYGGLPFLKGWFDEMRKWKPGMMTLIG